LKKWNSLYHYIYARAKRTFNDNVEAGTVLKSFSTIFAQILRLRQCCCHPVLTRKKAILAEEEDAASVADEANDLKDDMDLQEPIDRFTSSTDVGSCWAQRTPGLGAEFHNPCFTTNPK
jgi:DNA repair protein RAD5